MAVNKIYPNSEAALAGLLRDGMTIMSGGFGLCGIPSALIEAIPELTEMDLNPVKVLPPGKGATVVDARMRLHPTPRRS